MTSLALIVPGGARAADSLGAGGIVIPGSAMAVGVSGAPNTAGSIEARFSAVGTPLFWGPDTSTMNDRTASIFALNTPSGLYSAQSTDSVDNAPFTQTSAPSLTGTGTAGDPYVVTSRFDANSGVHIVQTVAHVSGTTRFTATWAVTNGTGAPSNFQGFEGADVYVNGNNSGNGTKTGLVPNRVINSIAPDGTQAQIVEQTVSPWSHFFSGQTQPFFDSTGDSGYGSLPDTIDPTNQDSGEGVEWDFTLANGATKTLSVVWSFTHPSLPQAPQMTGGLPAQNGQTNSTTVRPAFTYASGDAANSLGFQCAIDGGSFSSCTSPVTVSGLADGSHTFSVRATNSAGDPGPQTDRTFIVDTTPPGAPTLTGAPSGSVNTTNASISITGESGATLECSVDGGAYFICTSPVTITGLSDGNHSLSAKQTDAAGNAGTAVATASWTVDTTPPSAPTLSGAPSGTVAGTGASITLSGESGGSFRCSVDGGAYATCSSPFTLSGLSDGSHTVSVKQLDAAGNVSLTPATASWTVDTTPPSAPTLSGAPSGTVTGRGASITLSGESGASFRCSVDGGAYATCSSPLILSGLSDGSHTVSVRQLDAAGNASLSPATVSWIVDTQVPTSPTTTTPTTPGTTTPVLAQPPADTMPVTTSPSTPTTTTTPTLPIVSAISLTSQSVTWCPGCRYPDSRLRFTLSRPAMVRLVLTAPVRSGQQSIATTMLHGHLGTNSYRLAGRWHGALLPARRVQIRVQIHTDRGWQTQDVINVTVHSPFGTGVLRRR